MGRPKRVDLSAAIDAYMRGGPETVTEFPGPVMEFIDAIAKRSVKDAAMLREFLLRWQGHPQKQMPADLPATLVVVQAVKPAVPPQAPGGEGTSLSGSSGAESSTESGQRSKPRRMPIIETPDVLRLPPREADHG